jgi:hypothetical protein
MEISLERRAISLVFSDEDSVVCDGSEAVDFLRNGLRG